MKPEIKTTSEIEKRANEIKGKLWADYEEKVWVALDSLKEFKKETEKLIGEYLVEKPDEYNQPADVETFVNKLMKLFEELGLK